MDELPSRLERLAPPDVDVDAALAGVHAASRRRRARRRGLGAATVAVVAVLFTAMALTVGGGDDAAVVAGDPDGSTRTDQGPDTSAGPTDVVTSIAPGTSVAPDPATTTTPLAGSPPTSILVPAEGDDQHPTGAIPTDVTVEVAAPSEIEVVVTVERPVVVLGERVRVRVEVVNHSALPARFVGGGCGPIEVTGAGQGLGIGWLGLSWQSATSLADYVADKDLAPSRTPVPVGSGVARVGQVCPAILQNFDLGAGATIGEDFVWDPIAGASWTSGASALTVNASVQVAATAGFDVHGTALSGSATVAVTDDARAHAPRGPFIAAVAANPIIQGWLFDHGSQWDVQLGFANGATELWFVGNGAGLRVRGDAASGGIAEIRSVDPSYAPGDDPDSTFKDPNEQILFSG